MHMHVVTVNENEAMNLTESREGYMVGFGGGKRKKEK